MSENISEMDFKQLRNMVQTLSDELAIMKRKYEDIIYNLDTDNFSSRFVKEQGDMRTAIEVNAEGIKTKVSNEEFESTIAQTAESISSIVSEFVDVSQAVEVDSPEKFTDRSKIYVIRETDDSGNVVKETFYHYNTISKDWKPISADGIIYSLFEQKGDGFYLKGDVKVEGSCILTDSLTFDSSDNPLQVQYSVDGINENDWHSTFVSGSDKFMRLKIGANWSDPMKVVGTDGQDGSPGSDATITAEDVFYMLTDGGTTQGLFPAFYDGGEHLFINAEYIQAGTLSGDLIAGGTIQGSVLQNSLGTHTLMMVDSVGGVGDYGTFRLHNSDYGDVPYFSIYDDTFGSIYLYGAGEKFLKADAAGGMYVTAYGAWDFSGCESLDFGDFGVAVFG